MKIGLLLPSVLMARRFEHRIFAPKDLFISLANGLVKKGHKVFVYSSSNTITSANLISNNSPLEDMDFFSIKDLGQNKDIIPLLSNVRSRYEYGLDLINKAYYHAQKEKVDIMHIFMSSIGNYFSDYLQIPTVYTLDDLLPPPGSLERLRLQNTLDCKFIAISNSQKQDYEKELNIKIVGTVYHGIDVLSHKIYAKNGGNYFVMMGRLILEKGITDAINVCVKEEQYLKIATSANYKETTYYKDELKPLLKSKYVELHDFVQGLERDDFVGNAKALLFPINGEEAFGLVMVEAFRLGTPVIAYAKGSVSEIVEDGRTGFIVNYSEADKRGEFIIKKTGKDGLGEAIQKINSMSAGDYEQMRQNCRKSAEEKFTIEKMVDNYEKLYLDILSRKS